MRGIMYTQRGGGGGKRAGKRVQCKWLYTLTRHESIHSKPCKHKENQISISTNPLFNQVYCAWVQSNNTENTTISVYTLLMSCMILYCVIQLCNLWFNFNKNETDKIIMTLLPVSLIELLQLIRSLSSQSVILRPLDKGECVQLSHRCQCLLSPPISFPLKF